MHGLGRDAQATFCSFGACHKADGGGGGVEAGAEAGGALGELGGVHAVDGAVGVDFGFEDGVEAGSVEVLAALGDATVAAAFFTPAVG